MYSNIINKLIDQSTIDIENPYESISQDRIICLTEKLRKLLFPSYFEKITTDVESYMNNLITDISKTLNEEINYAYKVSNMEGNANKIVDEFINELPIVMDYLNKDIEALMQGDPAVNSKDEVILCYPGIFAITIYRLAHILYKKKVPLIPRIMSEYAHSKTGIDINPGAKIGKYFFIDHGTGVVIGETCVIGDNVKIYQGVTLGALSLRKGSALHGVKRHPTIMDNVTIYSGASIFGGNTVIATGATIGSSAFITESVKENEVVTLTCKKN